MPSLSKFLRRASLPAITAVCVTLLGGCRVHETSAAEDGLPGRYYVGWSEAGKSAEFTMLITSASADSLKGEYLVAYAAADRVGSVEGTATDSIRLTFRDGTVSGSFTGVQIGRAGLQGLLRIRTATNYLSRTTYLEKRKIEN